MKPQFDTGSIQFKILKHLNITGDDYGLKIANKLGLVLRKVYSPLRDLEFAKLVESFNVEVGKEIRGGRPRRYYSITEAGRREVLKSTEGIGNANRF